MTQQKPLKEIAVIVVLAALGVFLWLKFALPRLENIDLRVDQSKAVSIAKEFLAVNYQVNTDAYMAAAVSDVDGGTDRYLQKTIGVDEAKRLLSRLNYDMFVWAVRFFREKQKEDYKVIISGKTGEVIAFDHAIEDTAPRPFVSKEESRGIAEAELKRRFSFNPSLHDIHREDVTKRDNRQDYTFSWELKDVDIPWDKELGGGNAKLITTVVVSGKEVLSFRKAEFEIPDAFNRYISNLKQTGQSLSLIFRILYLVLLTLSIMMVVNWKHHMAPRAVKPFYIRVGIMMFVVMVVETLSGYQYVLFTYSTAQSFSNHLLRQFIDSLVNPFFVVLAFILPSLAGESLRLKVDPEGRDKSFLAPVLSSFFTRSIAGQILTGYGIAFIVLGAQAVIFNLGYRYCGVWDELSWLTQATTNVFPALTALLIGLHASFAEETMFRLFAINLFRKYGKTAFFSVFLSAVIWGFGHTGYEIFPMWFRGLEVTCLGIILGVAYLRYGLIAVITAHFFMDAFLASLPYLLNPDISFNFYSAVFVILLPLFFAVLAYFRNRVVELREWKPQLNAQQQFNCRLIVESGRSKSLDELELFKEDLLRHGWDPVVVERAFLEVKGIKV